ncbi:energy-coupling factor transporter ATP-binding protein EcfA 2 [Clostridium sp. CAG:628]|nr:energy-coupling factor transporter ATP-binding protein EcfA 2 [Clostridium sp. CAG:628]
MEITFNNVTYKENVRTPLEKTYLKNFSYTFKSGKVYSIIGDSDSGKEKIGLLINAVNKPLIGTIKIGKYLNDGKYIKNINGLRMNVGYLKENPNEFLFNKIVKSELEFGLKYFKYKLNKKNIRISEALKLVGLNEEYLKRRIDSLNISEKKKVSLASILIFNPGVIILEEPSIFLNYRDNEKLIKLIKLLKDKYNKTIILISKDTNLSYKVSDEIILLNKGSIVYAGNKSILEDEKVLNNINVDVPEIVKFINISNKFDANLTYTSNILDLIKEVYRNAK